MKILLPENVILIINTLEKEGYEAYAVGGCVRDTILGKSPDDWDITTSALPNEVKSLFKRTIDTGIDHGTVTIMLDKEGFEVTTYRIDGEYNDSRHPLEVTFTKNLIEDLKRRDFTINAMAYNDRVGLVDQFCGIEDIKNGIIRCVGNPMERFQEDALRIMRAIRFSAQLGYEIEMETQKAIKEMAPNLAVISVERIQIELIKLLMSENPMFLKTAYELGVTKAFMPEFDEMMETKQNNPHHSYNVGDHTLRGIDFCQANKILRLSMLFHDIGKPRTLTTSEDGIDHFYNHQDVSTRITKKILKRMHFDNLTTHFVLKIVFYHDIEIFAEKKSIRRTIHKVGEEVFPLLLQIKVADIKAQSTYMRQDKLDKVGKIMELYQEIISHKDCLSLKSLEITGRDLIMEGMAPGKGIGDVLKALLEMVIEEPTLNQKEILLEKVKDLN